MAIAIADSAVVSPGAKIADTASVGPFCVVEEDVEIGAGTRLDSHVVIKRYTTLGENNRLYPGVVLGNDPEDRNFTGERSYLQIGHRNVFRENSSVSRGTPPESKTLFGGRQLHHDRDARCAQLPPWQQRRRLQQLLGRRIRRN